MPNLKVFINKRVLYSNYPSCNQKIIITGKGKVEIGKNCCFGYKLGGYFTNGVVEIQPRYSTAVIKIGDNVRTNNNIFFCAANYIEIGSHALIGNFVTILDHEAHGISPRERKKTGEIGKVIIGENVWIGSNVIILKNSVIGNNSIIAAGAVVSGEFPDNVMIGGVPAKFIRSIQ